MEKKYIVSGTWEGKEIKEEVFAYSDKQAKFKAGLSIGLNNGTLSKFLNSGSIKVRRTK